MSDSPDVVVDEDDPCPGHRRLDGYMQPCDLPYGHGRVPELRESLNRMEKEA